MMPSNTDIVTPEQIVTYLDVQFFDRDSILKCGYWYTQSYLFTVEGLDGLYGVILRPFPRQTIANPEMVYTKLRKDLLDFQLRNVITKETQNVRDLLIAKAFANGALDESFKDDFSDPVGL